MAFIWHSRKPVISPPVSSVCYDQPAGEGRSRRRAIAALATARVRGPKGREGDRTQSRRRLLFGFVDPFGCAKPRLLRRGEKARLRVNPEQALPFRAGESKG